MMRSMYSGVSGLRVHQTKMDVVGNNIANVNTAGFKAQRVTFNEVFSQTLQSASAASDETGRGGRNAMQVGLGVNVASIDLKMTTGATQRTDNPFDLMIDGDGFIIVGDNEGTYFTRAGALRADEDGNIVIPNGMRVMGWQPKDDTGKEIQKAEVSPININKFRTAEPKATTGTSLEGNLNINDGVLDADGKGGITTQLKMYDSLGNYYSTNIKLVYDAATGWNASFSSLDTATGNVVLTDTAGNKIVTDIATADIGDFTFDTDGKLIGFGGVAGDTTIDLAAIDLTASTPPVNAVIGNAGVIELDITNLTQYTSKTDLQPKTVDGTSAGKLTGYAVGGDGIITATYDNGMSKMLGQIAVAEFENPAGLEKAGDNLFRVTSNSGGFDNIGKEGVFIAGVLEMSNVDLAAEFTEMITTQRGFQANSKIITTSDEMLQTLVNMK